MKRASRLERPPLGNRRRPGRSPRRPLLVLGFALVVGAGGCDSGPKGPGTLSATVVSSQPLGAVVLDFTGGGITGFESQGDTQLYSASLGGSIPHYRVILVSPSGAEIRFGIKVSEVSGARPTVAAVTATSPTNEGVLPSGLQIKIGG